MDKVFVCGILTVLLAGFTQRTGGSLVFTKQPPKTVYVFRGYDSSLEWKFYNDTIPAEFSFVTWEVYVAGLGWKKLKQENNQGLLIDHSEQPVQFRNRLEKRGQATLVIKNMTFEDSSRYRCILTTFGGTRTESDVEVVVIGQAVCNPHIQFVKEGDSATITCNATNVPSEYMTCITQKPSDSEKVANCSQLTVMDVSASDGGYYSCVATVNISESNMASCYLQVIDPLKRDYSSCPSVSHIARIGQNLSICCPVSSYPPPIVTWKKNGTQLQQGSETVLTIILDKDDKFGTYTCSASDGKPSTEPIIVTVITVTKEISELLVTPTNGTDAKAAKVEWTPHTEAEYYLVDIRGLDDIIFDDLVYVGKETSLEIYYNTLVTKNAEKKPEKIEVCPVVSAFGNGTVIARTSKTCLTVRSHQLTLKADIACFLLVFIGYLV